MSNERFLQVSYFVVLFGSLLLGWLTYALLRRQFFGVCDGTPRSRLAPIVRRFFLIGLVGPPVLGFCSVSYLPAFSCNITTYEQIIKDRAYLIQVSQAQLQAALEYTIIAVLLWCLMVFALLLTSGK